MGQHEPLSGVFIGQGTLLVQCAERFQAAGHVVRAVVSVEPRLQEWARAHGVPVLVPLHASQEQPHYPAEPPDGDHAATPTGKHFDDIMAALAGFPPFDYLFSIVNLSVLPAEFLALPRRGAINFHDALLPRYAGRHATSWAILHGERTHGVTWHEMTERVDAGRILKQAAFDLSPGETAVSLNARCYEAGIESFAELIDELASGRLQPQEPRLQGRTYFSRYKRPAANGLISWQQPAEAIGDLVAALDFGPYDNPLALAKILAGGEALVATRLAVLDRRSGAAPGTVTAIGDAGLQVATGTTDVLLDGFTDLDGRPVTVTDLAGRYGLAAGERLGGLDHESSARLTRLHERLARQEEFWLAELLRLQPPDLPYADRSRGRSAPGGHPGADCVLPTLEPSEGCRRTDLLLGAFAVYLARVCDQEVLTIGYAEPRLTEQVHGWEAFFAARVPLTVTFAREASVETCLQLVQAQLAALREARTFARDLIARHPERRPRMPQGGFAPAVVFERIADLDGYQPATCSELTLAVSDDGRRCRWFYDERVFSPNAIAAMQRQFLLVLAEIAGDRGRPLAAVPLLSEAERRQVLVEWNRTEQEYDASASLSQLFEAQVDRTPDAAALIGVAERLTYRELNAAANRLAHELRARGAGAGTIVGVCLERSPAAVTAILAVLKAGAAYLPLDPAYPSERLASMASDAGIRLLLTEARLRSRLPDLQAEAICLDSDAGAIARQSDRNPECRTAGDDPAYVIYTSGSTGRPKGVIGLHRGAVNRCRWMWRAYPFEAGEVCCQKTGLSFVDAVWEIFGPLLRGVPLVVIPDATLKDARLLVEALAAEAVTRIVVVPSLLRVLLEAHDDLAVRVPWLRYWTSSGEALSAELACRFRERLPGAVLLNLYGQSEAAGDATFHEVDERPCAGTTAVGIPIGRPIDNMRTYVLDSCLQPVPAGIRGELYVAGAGLARGYLGRAELTAERFLPDPFAAEPGATFYRTGDLARYLPDGTLEYLGRADQQVKIRGFRVELGEVEAVLRQHPRVAQSCVVARDDDIAGKRLVAYVVPAAKPADVATAEPADPVALRDWLRARLPDSMLPSAIVSLASLPLTPSGQIDRTALPEPDRAPRETAACLPPRTETERALTELWGELLGASAVGAQDDFFDIGGHSLLAVRLFARVEKAFGVRLPVATLFRGSTVEQLAAAIDAVGAESKWPLVVPLRETGALPPLFCLHPLSGDVLVYTQFPRYLGPGRPIYAIQARGMDGQQEPDRVLEEMAAVYVQEIRAVQPSGPYHLTGYSSGASVAYEIACQLAEAGEEIGLLVLIDSAADGVAYMKPKLSRHFVAGVLRTLPAVVSDWLRADGEHRRESAARLGATIRARLRGTGAGGASVSLEKAGQKMADYIGWQVARNTGLFPPEQRRVMVAQFEAWRKYRPRPYSGHVTLLRARRHQVFCSHEPTMGWATLVAGGVDVRTVPGDHMTMMSEPHIGALAQALDRCLAEVAAGPGRASLGAIPGRDGKDGSRLGQ